MAGPVGEHDIRVLEGTEVGKLDVLFGDAGVHEDFSVDSPEIEHVLLLFCRQPSVRIFERSELRVKMTGNVPADLVVSAGYGRTDRGKHITGIRPKLALHSFYCYAPHLHGSSLPARMGKTNRMVDRIREVKRNTVGIKGRKNDTWLIGNETVNIEPVERTRDAAAAVRPANTKNVGRVGLVRAHDIFCPKACGIGKESEVLEHICKTTILPGILVGERVTDICVRETGILYNASVRDCPALIPRGQSFRCIWSALRVHQQFLCEGEVHGGKRTPAYPSDSCGEDGVQPVLPVQIRERKPYDSVLLVDIKSGFFYIVPFNVHNRSFRIESFPFIMDPHSYLTGGVCLIRNVERDAACDQGI